MRYRIVAVRRIKPRRAELVPVEIIEPERFEQAGTLIEVGQWYWVNDDEEDEEGEPQTWFGCAIHVGSNYVKVEGIDGSTLRVHLDEVDDYLTPEQDPRGVLDGRAQHYKDRVTVLMEKVNAVTARLGVSPRAGIDHKPESETYALVRVTGDQPSPDAYKHALVRAKDEELPELFKQIEEANESLATWLKAEMIPMKALALDMESCVEKIEGRIFNVSLYAGLTEEIVQARKGKPAHYDEKLHLMQRMLFMDEECLLDYRHGGMEFKSLKKFDRWISKRKNMDRILPHPRCMVAMRVRRNRKDRYAPSLLQAYINMQLAEHDESTFLYIRNGAQLFRLECGLDFDELIFPDRDEFDPSQPTMFHRSHWGEISTITLSDYEERVESYLEAVKGNKRWRRKNPFKSWRKAWIKAHRIKGKPGWVLRDGQEVELTRLDLNYNWNKVNPYVSTWGDLKRKDPRGNWEPFDRTSVYFDEVIAKIKSQVDYYNRLALIVQGLYDRSNVLHPHPPAKTWTPEGFAAAVTLVYDSDRVLHAGEEPCFKTYSAQLRESLTGDSVVIGQERLWLKHVQAKEYERRRNNWHYRSYEETKVSSVWRPSGDSGPGRLARIARLGKPGATFRWERERRGKSYWSDNTGDLITSTFTVATEGLFNVSAYTPGDFLQFFQDPRTRAQYLRWAPFLLCAEDYHAGKAEAQEPPVQSVEPTLDEISDRINTHLERMEKDPKINKTRKSGISPFYYAGASRHGRYCRVVYVSFQGSRSLTKGEAWKYLQWLDSGKNGKHHSMKEGS